jgi:phage/plasmid-associated DNA primase
LQRMVVHSLNRTLHGLPSDPDIRPALWCDEMGQRSPVEIDEETNSCRSVRWEHVKAGIARFAYQLASFEEDYSWVDAQTESCLRMWRTLTLPIPKPLPWGFKSGIELCYNRLTWDPNFDPAVEIPTWQKILNRMSDPETFKAFVGSLFFEKAYRQKYFYLHGDGGDGKGCIARFLERIFGEAYFGLQDPPKDKFFGTPFQDRRLVCFTDLRKPEFLQSCVVMGITGGDTLQLEKKGVDVVNHRARCLLMFLSNLPPVISLTAHDMRRILYCFISAQDDKDRWANSDAYEEELWKEGPGFIGQCIETYKRRCPSHQAIEQPDEVKEQIREFAVDPFGDEFADFAYDTFSFPNKIPDQKKEDRFFVTAETVRHLVSQRWPQKSDHYYERFKKWLQENKDVSASRRRFEDGQHRVFYDLSLKSK